MKKKLFSYLFVCFFVFISCKETTKKEIAKEPIKSTIEYAKGFDISTKDGITKLIIKSPYPKAEKPFEYVLSKEKTENTIQVPIKKMVVTSTTHIPILELLSEENSLIGFPHAKYISSEKTRVLIDAGKIKELGKDATLNTEIVLDIKPELVVGYSMEKTNKAYKTVENAGIPVILNGDWLEETPLGRAEWIKFFGVLYDKEKQADSIFNQIKADYVAATKIAKKAITKPTILSGAIMSKDIWNLPAGESFVAQFLKDANVDYLWKDTKGKGSLSLSFESILDKGKEADFWIAPGYFSSKEQMLKSNKHYAEFKAFKNDAIYTPSTKKGKTGGVLYYELAPARPDLVLKDIIKITNPKLLPNYELTFFEKMQ